MMTVQAPTAQRDTRTSSLPLAFGLMYSLQALDRLAMLLFPVLDKLVSEQLLGGHAATRTGL